MYHDLFGLTRWLGELPLDRLRAEARECVLERRRERPGEYPTAASVEEHLQLMEPKGEAITGPRELALFEALRAEAFAGIDAGPSAPTAVFVWAEGEAARRETTRVGGLPYLPRDHEWPLDAERNPRLFVGQLCFADTLDLTGPLPGDTLLIFGDVESALCEEPDALAFIWVDRDEPEADLIDAADVSAGASPWRPVHGVLHRTVDLLREPPEAVQRQFGDVQVIEGTKIGGVPAWIQGDPGLPGRFLATLGSIQPRSGDAHPLLDQAESMDFATVHADDWLRWGDVGALYLTIDEFDTLHWEVQCY